MSMRVVGLVVAALLLSACADWNTGRVSSVIDARVVRVVSQGTRDAGQPGLLGQPYQVLELQLDGGLYRGDSVTLEWGGQNALNANGLLAAGDRVLVTQNRGDGSARQYAIQEEIGRAHV